MITKAEYALIARKLETSCSRAISVTAYHDPGQLQEMSGEFLSTLYYEGAFVLRCEACGVICSVAVKEDATAMREGGRCACCNAVVTTVTREEVER